MNNEYNPLTTLLAGAVIGAGLTMLFTNPQLQQISEQPQLKNPENINIENELDDETTQDYPR